MFMYVCKCIIFFSLAFHVIFSNGSHRHLPLWFFSGAGPASVLPMVSDICASIQHTVLSHMAKRLYRAFMFCGMKELLPENNRTLVSKVQWVTL